MSLQDIKLSIFKDLQSYESKAVGLDTVLWWIKCDLSVQQKTELYRNLAKTITREEANKKVKDSIMPANHPCHPCHWPLHLRHRPRGKREDGRGKM